MQVSAIRNDYNNRANTVAFKQILRNDIPAKALANNKYFAMIG